MSHAGDMKQSVHLAML